MKKEIAEQIADLLNRRNELDTQYTGERVLSSADNYVFKLENDRLLACAEIKKVQWYQWEVSHVSVQEDGKGFGKSILSLAEDHAIQNGAKVIQCTIRSTNKGSIGLFESRGYSKGISFYNPNTTNWVHVYQKALSTK